MSSLRVTESVSTKPTCCFSGSHGCEIIIIIIIIIVWSVAAAAAAAALVAATSAAIALDGLDRAENKKVKEKKTCSGKV